MKEMMIKTKKLNILNYYICLMKYLKTLTKIKSSQLKGSIDAKNAELIWNPIK